MTNWKRTALTAYYWATLPSRRRAAINRAARHLEPVRILFYHRVADEHPNDWTISTNAFAKQIDWLRSHYDIVSLEEAQARIARGRNCWPTACITFDDGYADNMRFAVPLLLKHRIPFMYFVSTLHVLGGRSFPHDVRRHRPLTPNTPAQLRQLADAGVEIGSHTRRHFDLGGDVCHEQLEDEIVRSKWELGQAIGCDVRYFAFPYGQHENLSSAAYRMAFEAGYRGVCSAYGGYNFPGDDAFHLRRFHADPELIRFKNWLTIDPRKLRKHCDFDPGDYRTKIAAEAEKSVSIRQAFDTVSGVICAGSAAV